MKNYGFNLKHQDLLNQLDSNVKFELNLFKNKVMLTGDASTVERFYKESVGKFSGLDKYEKAVFDNAFWSKVQSNNARVFFGITKMINDAFVRLITNGGLEARVYIDEEENEDEAQTLRLNEILEFNSFEDKLWGKGESLQSGLGYFAYKVDIDTDNFEHPVIDIVDPAQIETISTRGFVVGFKFKKRYKVGDSEYEVHEVHRKENKNPIIEYLVWKDDSSGGRYIDFKDIDLDTAKQLGLTYLKNNEHVKIDTINDTLSKLHDLPVLLKNNTAYNSFFTNSPYGEADTQGIDTIEDALSEVISGMVEEIRKGKIKTLISEELLTTLANGDKATLDEFKTSYEVIKGSDEQGKQYIETIQGDINTEKYLAGARELIADAINKANLHPITVGVTGLESIAAGSESQQEREKTSLRTREMKLKSWRKSLKKLFNTLLQAQDIIDGNEPQDYNVHVDFGDFSNPNPASVIELLNKGLTNGLFSLKEAKQQFYGDDLTDKELMESVVDSKIEKDMVLTPAERISYNKRMTETLEVEQSEIDEEETRRAEQRRFIEGN